MLSSLPLVVYTGERLKLMRQGSAIVAQADQPFSVARVARSHLRVGGDGVSQHVLRQVAQFRAQAGPVEAFAKCSDIHNVTI